MLFNIALVWCNRTGLKLQHNAVNLHSKASFYKNLLVWITIRKMAMAPTFYK